jgi:hypothetical protein
VSLPDFLSDGRGRCAEWGNPDDFTNESHRTAGWQARARAVAVCRPCEHRNACLLWALDTNQVGVYGATTTKERRDHGYALARVATG